MRDEFINAKADEREYDLLHDANLMAEMLEENDSDVAELIGLNDLCEVLTKFKAPLNADNTEFNNAATRLLFRVFKSVEAQAQESALEFAEKAADEIEDEWQENSGRSARSAWK